MIIAEHYFNIGLDYCDSVDIYHSIDEDGIISNYRDIDDDLFKDELIDAAFGC